jgi:hypothetical protein
VVKASSVEWARCTGGEVSGRSSNEEAAAARRGELGSSAAFSAAMTRLTGGLGGVLPAWAGGQLIGASSVTIAPVGWWSYSLTGRPSKHEAALLEANIPSPICPSTCSGP